MSDTAQGRAVKHISYQDQVLTMLQKAGPRGCTSEELMTVHHRFSASVWSLKHEGGFNIQTRDRVGTDLVTYVLKEPGNPLAQADLLQPPLSRPSARQVVPLAAICECGHTGGQHRMGGGFCFDCKCTGFTAQA